MVYVGNIVAEEIPVEQRDGRLNQLYDVLKVVGKGGYGVVLKARRKADGGLVAIKRVDVFDMTQRKRVRCFQEVKLFQGLESDHIISMYEAFIDENQLIIIFEWAAGGDLKRLVRKALERGMALPEADIWSYFLQIVEGVKYLHLQRIMHRDIKPANVMVCGMGKLKLGDLGLGREFSEESFDENKKAFSKVGTPYYVSPEVVKGGGYDWQSDIWSLGCLLYELANLKSPFEVEGANLYDIFQKISKCEYLPLPADKWSQPLRNLQSRMLQLDPSKRPNIDQVLEFARAMAVPVQPEIDLSMVAQSICGRLIVLSVDAPRCAAALEASGKAFRLPDPPAHALRQVHTHFFSHADIRRWALGAQRLQYGVLLCIVAWLLRLTFRREHAEGLEKFVILVEPGDRGKVHIGARNLQASANAVPYATDDAAACEKAASVMIEGAASVGVDVRNMTPESIGAGFGASVCALLDMLLLLAERRTQLQCFLPVRCVEVDEEEPMEILQPAYDAELRADSAPSSSRFVDDDEVDELEAYAPQRGDETSERRLRSGAPHPL